MILKGFLCVFFPDAEFDTTSRMNKVKEHSFKSEGKVLVIPGWM
jgi:DNA topoisomerase-3